MRRILTSFLLLFTLFFCLGDVVLADEKAIPERDKIFIRTGIHKNYFRIVFNMSKKVDYEINRISNALEIKFLEDFEFTSKSLNERPKYINDITVQNKPEENSMMVTIMVPIKSKIRKFWYGNSLVVDVFKPDYSSDYKQDEKKSDDKGKTKLVSKDLDKDQTKKSGAYESLSKNIIYSTSVKINDDNSFIINPEVETKCAVFKYAGDNYIVFDKKLSEKDIKQSLSGLFKRIDFVYNEKFSILKINNGSPMTITDEKVKGENGWLFRTQSPHVDFSSESEVEEKEKKRFNASYNITSLDQPYLKISTVKLDQIISFEDGAQHFQVIIPESNSINNKLPQYFNDMELLESSHGLAILDKSRNIKIQQKQNDLIITNKDPDRLLILSSPQERTIKSRQIMAPAILARKNKKHPAKEFEKIEDSFINKLVSINEMDIEKAALTYLDLANFYFDNELYFEAASNFEFALKKNPRLKNSKNIMAKLALAWLMTGVYDKSSNILHSYELLKEKELNPYRVALYSQKKAIAKKFNIKKYFELKPLVVEIAKTPGNIQDFIKEETMKFALDNSFVIDDLLSTIPEKSKKDDIRIVYYQARNALLHDDNMQAERLFDKVLSLYKKSDDSQIYTVPAKFHKIMISYSSHKIDIKQTIEKLDTMRYLWLDPRQRLKYLTTMNDLYEKAGYVSNLLDNVIYIKNLYPDYFNSHPQIYQTCLKKFKDTIIGKGSFNDSFDLVIFYNKFKDHFEVTDIIDKVNIYERLADAFNDLYLLDEAKVVLQKIIKIKDEHNKIDKDYYRYKLAKVCLDMGEYKDTINTIKKIRSYDKNLEITKALAIALIEAGKFSEAKKIVTNKKYQDNEDILKISLKLAFESSDNLLSYHSLEKLLRLQLNQNRVDPNTIISLVAVLKDLGDIAGIESIKNKYASYIKDPKQRALFNEISKIPNKPKLKLEVVESFLKEIDQSINAIKEVG